MRQNFSYFVLSNNSGTRKSVAWKTLEVCHIQRKEEAQDNLRLWLLCSTFQELTGTKNVLVMTI